MTYQRGAFDRLKSWWGIIQEQDAEIERLKKENERLSSLLIEYTVIGGRGRGRGGGGAR